MRWTEEGNHRYALFDDNGGKLGAVRKENADNNNWVLSIPKRGHQYIEAEDLEQAKLVAEVVLRLTQGEIK